MLKSPYGGFCRQNLALIINGLQYVEKAGTDRDIPPDLPLCVTMTVTTDAAMLLCFLSRAQPINHSARNGDHQSKDDQHHRIGRNERVYHYGTDNQAP